MAKSKQVLLKRSNVKGKVPALSAMTHGEMFLNYNDGVLMSKSSSNAVLKWSDDSKMATKNELNLKLDKIEAEGSYVKNADFQYLVSEIEDNERVITTAFERFRESAGFNENGESTLGKSLTEAITELDGVKALANKVTVDGNTVKITTLSANTFSANTAKVGSLSANTLSATTIRTTNISATTVSAHTIKSLTMSANTISGNTIRATAMSANTISASTIKSTTTDDLRRDIGILSGDTYILNIEIGNAEYGSVISKTLSSDEISKIESAKDVIVNMMVDNGEGYQLKTTCFMKEEDYILLVASTTIPINYSDDDNNAQGYTTTIGMQISIEKESNILMAQVGYVYNHDYSSIINDISNSFLTINLGDYESYSDDNGSYILVDYDFEDKLSNCVGAKVIIPGQIEAYLTSKTTHRPVNEAPYHVYGFTCLRINRDNDKYNYLYGDIIELTTSSTNKIYVNWGGQITIGYHALDSYSAKTSYSAVTSTSAKTSVSAITSFSAATAKSADSAKKLSTGRTITLSGDVVGSVSFDGSSNVTLNTTIKSTTTDDLRKDIDTLSGDTYILQFPYEALDTEIYTIILSEDEYEKIKNANDIILRFDSGDGMFNDILSGYISKSDDNVYCLFDVAIPNSKDSVLATTFMCSIYEGDGEKVCVLQVAESLVGGDLIYIDANANTVKTDEDGRSYIDFDYNIYDKLLNCKGGSLNYAGLGIYKFEASGLNEIDGERYVTAYFTSSIFDDGFTIPTNGTVYNVKSLSHHEFVLTVYPSNTDRAYLEWKSTQPIGMYANLSNSAVTSTSAKTSYSATTATSAETSYSATTVSASGVKGVLSSDNMPTTINKAIRYTARQHFDGDIHVCGDGSYGGAIYFGDYDEYHELESNNPLVYIKEKDDDILDIIGNGGVRIGNLVDDSDGSESYEENYAIIVDGDGNVIINDLVGYATSDEVDENNEILTKALNRLNTSAGFNSLGESTLPSGMSLTKAILELQKGGGVADKVNVTESSSKSYIVSRETTDSDETSLHYDGAIWSENGQLYASSDKNLKEHVGNVDGNPELIKRIPKVFYHWKYDEQKRIQMGTYAQDIEKVYPEVVSRDDNGNLAVGYDRLSVIALAGIDELYKMIQDLKEENKQLRKELDSLKK